jgi:hypothetical protein
MINISMLNLNLNIINLIFIMVFQLNKMINIILLIYLLFKYYLNHQLN